MGRSEGDEVVPVPRQHVARLQLLEPDPVRQLPEDPLQRREEVDEPRRAVDRQVDLAAPEGEGLQHSRQAQIVVGVVVREKNLAQLDEADRRAEHLPLRPLRAVEE